MSRPAQVLLLDHAIYREVYRPLDHWRAAIPAEVPVTALPADAPPPPLETFTHVIVSGSEASIVEPDPWVDARIALVREAADRGLAVLGSCHGHQLLALALGGEVGRAAVPEMGWFALDVDEDAAMFRGSERPPWVFASHFDEVTVAPPRCDVVARSPRCAIHAFAHRDRPLWGVQAHPEIGPAAGRALLDAFAAFDPRIAEAEHDGEVRDSGWIDGLVRAFLAAGPSRG